MATRMTRAALMLAWPSLFHLATVSAQTFPGYQLPNIWPGISPVCQAALNTTVQCSKLLPQSAEGMRFPRLNAQNLTTLCTAACLSSLNSARQTIQAACTLATDVIPLNSGTFPATYLVDLFAYAYGINCHLDPTTQQYCDVLLVQWLNQPSLTAAQKCSDCLLGGAQMQLNSPFGYSDAFASEFRSLTSSCSKTVYTFTSPPPYTAAISTSATPSPSPPALAPGCVTLYTINAGDTCDSIAVSQNVSTWAIYGATGIVDCTNLPTGSQLCLQGQCLLYQVQAADTCDSIITAAHIVVSPSMFVAWNPNIDSLCSNLDKLVGYRICLRFVDD
ncbi:hypothetical protein BR93DRAFT_423031 [Coniochaeta sp. PMI_546]|nr:hypothetical protein BR93DRAFT_423031 [Coniochaeta sp. PMI_546]